MRYCLKILVCVIILAFTAPAGVKAFSLAAPFGGRVLTFTPCTCAPGTAIITVSGPKPGAFLYTPFARAFSYIFPSIGRWILGLASNTVAPCMMGAPPYCAASGFYRPIIMFGTSFK